jgi:hypothetical protein
MDLYKARVGVGISDEERSKLIFREVQELEEEVNKKAKIVLLYIIYFFIFFGISPELS